MGSDVEVPSIEQDGKPERGGDHETPAEFLAEFEEKEAARARKRSTS